MFMSWLGERERSSAVVSREGAEPPRFEQGKVSNENDVLPNLAAEARNRKDAAPQTVTSGARMSQPQQPRMSLRSS